MRAALVFLLLVGPVSAQEIRFITATDTFSQTLLPPVTVSAGKTVLIHNTSTANALSVASVEGVTLSDSLPVSSTGLYACDGITWRRVIKYDPAGGGVAGAHNFLSATHPDTTPSAATDDAVPLGTGAAWVATTFPNCLDSAGQHLNYSNAFNTFSCGTSSSGATNSVDTTIDLGTTGGLVFTTAVAATWVAAGSEIVCTPYATSADGLTVETVLASGVQPVVSNKNAGVGFDLSVYSPHGATGVYRIHCLGV